MTSDEKKSGFDRRSQSPHDGDSREEGSFFERMPDGIKRGIESLLREGRIKHILGDLKLPKEIVAHLMSQIDETKHAALGVISREVRLFLERTNLSDELAKLLTQISFEVKTQVRFVPSDNALKRKIKTEVTDLPGKDRDPDGAPPKSASQTRRSTPPPPDNPEDDED